MFGHSKRHRIYNENNIEIDIMPEIFLDKYYHSRTAPLRFRIYTYIESCIKYFLFIKKSNLK